MKYRCFGILLLAIVYTGRTATASPPIPGNILVTYNSRIYEITTVGDIRQSFSVPAITPDASRRLGDIVYDPAGFIHVRINSASVPCLISTLNVYTNTWTNTPVSNFSSGGRDLEMAQLGGKLYTERNQFDLSTRTSVNIKPTMHFTHPQDSGQNITLGQDGYFYATSDFTPATEIYRIDPTTYEQVGDGLGTVNPAGERLNVLGMAVKLNGDYYVADFRGRVFAFSQASTYIANSVAIGEGPADLSLSSAGLLAFGQSDVGDNFGTFAVLNQNLQVLAQVTLQSSSITDAMYTTFVEVPEPHSLLLACCSAAGLGACARSARLRAPSVRSQPTSADTSGELAPSLLSP